MKPFFLISSIFILASCNKDKDNVEVTREVDAFTTVHLNSTFNVSLMEDSSYYIEIIGKAKIVNQIEIVNENGVLSIERGSSNDWLSPQSNKVEIIIHSLPLSEVYANETCNIKTINPITSNEFGLVMKEKASEATLDLDCTTFYFWNNQPTGGKVILRGQCYALKLWTTALITVDANDLTCEYCIVDNGSKGDCSVRVNTLFEYRLKDNGNINIYGSPTQTNVLEHTGLGLLVVH